MPSNALKTVAPRRFAARRVLAIVATVAAWCALTVENGAQQVQTDWAVSGPAPVLSGPSPADLRQQMLLDSIFFVNTPVLKKPAPPPVPSAQREPETSWLRFATRPDGVDGWQAASDRDEPEKRVHHPPLSHFFSTEPAAAAPSAVTHDPAPVSAGTELVMPSAPRPPDQSGRIVVDGDLSPVNERPDAAAEEVADDDREPDVIIEDSSADVDGDEENQSLDDKQQSAGPIVLPPEQKPLPPLTRQLVNLRARVRGVLKGYYRKPLNSREHNPWEAMHGMLAYELQSRILQGGPRGAPITSVGWLCYNKPCKGQTLMHVTREGKLRAKYGVGLQGHLGQLLAMLAQCGVSPDYPILVGKYRFTVQDLIEAEKETCYPDSELTFKLLAFQYYLDLDEQWVNERGDRWDIPRLIREELAQPIRGAACGGTHRLSSLSLAVKARVRRGEPLDGEYGRAAEFVRKHHQYAFQLQNRDGSLSTSWFRGRGDESNIDRRIKTTGHILEWLCYSLSDEELRDQRTIRAVSYLANLMYSNYNHDWEVGPVSHATHALLIYDERVFQPYDRPDYTVSYRPKRPAATRPQPNSVRR